MRGNTIGKKLYLTFSAIIILMVAMGGLSVYELSRTTNAFGELTNIYHKISSDGKDINIALLAARRDEQEFISHRNEDAIENMDRSLMELRSLAERIIQRAEQVGLEVAIVEANNILKGADSYAAGFDQAVALLQQQNDKTIGIKV